MLNLRDHLQALRADQIQGKLDLGLILPACALLALGVVMVASSSIAVAEGDGLSPFYYLYRHLVFLALGLGLAGFLVIVPLEKIEQHHLWLLLGVFVLLALPFVPGLGVRINGARRWINLGVSNFQVVEMVKLMLIAYLASYMVRLRPQLRSTFGGILKPLGIAGLMMIALLAQPDFGSASLILAITLGMIWLGGAKPQYLAAMGATLLPVMVWAATSAEYRMRRLTSFLNPWKDPFDDGFQLTQALIAVGRGEWFGVGLGASIQKLFYLPEAHTDFIFAVIAEELGLAGVALVLALFAWMSARMFVLGMRGLRVGADFAAYCLFGIAIWLSVQAMVSIGVNLGVLPTKGLTLPLISSGGSSMLMTIAALGLALRAGFEITRAERLAEIRPEVIA
ncbi:putative lipid II flippase FtsW [Ahniella affigens]|uniref:Probable peptidoglycan glycosyltransferase FtsW n=1 Tax=Ahniella affigens TaxID=2021234 RepID=A0A2P1PM54_9GAMM|nr:putative lipid II flippase FtsW [Ahniella affigens]AVP95916.1 putative lipid II flippase FtsW [Ahniella affigens]